MSAFVALLNLAVTLLFHGAVLSTLPQADTSSVQIPPGVRVVAALPGEHCIVCGATLGKDGFALIIRGRRFPLDREHLDEFLRHSEHYFALKEPRGALFQESSHAPAGTTPGETSPGWFLMGAVVVTALLSAGITAYVALTHGLNAGRWFIVGLVFNVFGVLSVALRASGIRRVSRGLNKLPLTSSPIPCPSCGSPVHPSAMRCAMCGTVLNPVSPSEAARTLNR
ncbi:MAG: hypothetical protein WB699_06085 [Bacteroidota bacterium]